MEDGAIQAAGGTMIYILRRRLLAQAGKAQPGSQPLAVALARLPIHKHGQSASTQRCTTWTATSTLALSRGLRTRAGSTAVP